MTIRESVINYLRVNPGKSAYIISQDLDLQFQSVSSLIKRMTDKGDLIRKPNLGPKSGFGYFLNQE